MSEIEAALDMLYIDETLDLFHWIDEPERLKAATKDVFRTCLDKCQFKEFNPCEEMGHARNKIGALIVGLLHTTFRDVVEETHQPWMEVDAAIHLDVDLNGTIAKAVWETFQHNFYLISVVVSNRMFELRKAARMAQINPVTDARQDSKAIDVGPPGETRVPIYQFAIEDPLSQKERPKILCPIPHWNVKRIIALIITLVMILSTAIKIN